MNPKALRPEDLTRLRPFVLALVADEATADDVLQDTWLRAAERMPDGLESRSALAWARRTAERLVLNRGRAGGRRARREAERIVSKGVVDEPAEALEHLELLQATLGALAELPEVDRRAVTLRYLKGHTGREVAELLGMREGATRQRISRALDRLRSDLDEQHGGQRAAWAVPLAALARRGATGAAVLSWKAGAAAACLGLAGLAGVAVALSRPTAGPQAPATLEIASAQGAAPVDTGLQLVRPVTRVESAPEDSDVEPPAAEAPAPRVPPGGILLNLVSEATGAPVPEATVDWFTSAPILRGSTRADARGRFALPREARFSLELGLIVESERLGTRTLRRGTAKPLQEVFPGGSVLLEPATELRGRVVDDEGRGMADVRIELPESRASTMYGIAWAPQHEAWWTMSDAEGRFELTIPDSAQTLRWYRPDFGFGSMQLTPAGRAESDVPRWDSTLEGPLAVDTEGRSVLLLNAAETVRFQVLDPSGAPLEGARAQFVDWLQKDDAPPVAEADARGELELHLPILFDRDLLVEAAGYRTRIVDVQTANLEGAITLRPAGPLVVEVVDPDGRPIPMASVELREASPEWSQIPGMKMPGTVPRLTEASGTATFSRASDRQFRLLVWQYGRFSQSLGFDAVPELPVRVVLHPRTRLIGSVRDASSGDLIEDVRSFCRAMDDAPTAFGLVEVRGIGGGRRTWGANRAPGGPFEIRLEAPGYRSRTFGPFESTGEPIEVDAELERLETLTGVLLDPDGRPVPNRPVTLLEGHVDLLIDYDFRWSNRNWPRTVRTDEAGVFRVSRPEGPATLIATTHGGIAFETWAEFELAGLELRGRRDATLRVGHGTERGWVPASSSRVGTDLAIHVEITSFGHGSPDARLRVRGQWSDRGGLTFPAFAGASTLVWSLPADAETPSVGATTHPRPFLTDAEWGPTNAYLEEGRPYAPHPAEPIQSFAGQMAGASGRIQLQLEPASVTDVQWLD